MKNFALLACAALLISSQAWAFPYNAPTGPQLAATYGWKDRGQSGFKIKYSDLYAVGLIQLARNARTVGKDAQGKTVYSYPGGGLMIEAGGQSFLVSAGNAGDGNMTITPVNGIFKYFLSTGGNPSALDKDVALRQLDHPSYSAWAMAMFADHEKWEARTDQCMNIVNTPGYSQYGCLISNKSVDRWYVGVPNGMNLSDYGLSNDTVVKVYAVGWRWDNLNLITVQCNNKYPNNSAIYINLTDRANPKFYHYYDDPRIYPGPGGKTLKQIIVAIDSENWGVPGNVIISLQYFAQPDDKLTVQASAIPANTPAKVWFEKSSSSTTSVPVNNQP